MKKDSLSITDLLRARGHKLTPQRRAVLAVLAANEGNPLTPEEIYRLAGNGGPKIGLTTVYRTLDLLQRIGVVNHVHYHQGCIRYEAVSSRHRHYLICLHCGKAQPAEVCLPRETEKEIEEEMDFTVTDHCLSLFGYCANCQGRS